MNIQTATNLFIVPPRLAFAELYQQLLSGFMDYELMGNALIGYLERARALRQFETLAEYGLILSNIPIGKFQTIGQYYIALSLCSAGRGQLDEGRALLEKVASIAPLKYRAEAMISLSAISWAKNQPNETFKYCLEATQMGSFDLTTIKALRGIAVLKSREGFHRSALHDLENLYSDRSYAVGQKVKRGFAK